MKTKPSEIQTAQVRNITPPPTVRDYTAAKIVKVTPDVPQAEIDAIHARLNVMRKRLKSDILFIGARLYRMREKLPHGRWTRFVEETFPLSVKTANIWIRAWEGRNGELALTDWDAYMRQLYGHEPKALKDAKKEKQHGKPGLEPGHDREEQYDAEEDFEDDTFSERGRPGIYYYKKFVQVLDRLFLGSVAYPTEVKREFCEELIRYLQAQLENL